METKGNVLLNGLVGAALTLLLSYLPFTPLIGGGAAGYLHKRGIGGGAATGFIAGMFVLFPLYIILLFVFPLFFVAPFGVVRIPVNAAVFAILLFIGTSFYTLTLSTLGGVVGGYLAPVAEE